MRKPSAADITCLLMGLIFASTLIIGSVKASGETGIIVNGRRRELPPASTSSFQLDINSATARELTVLPGIGEKLAAAVVEWREENGAFESVDELIDVPGIGEAKLEAFRRFICVEVQDENTGS